MHDDDASKPPAKPKRSIADSIRDVKFRREPSGFDFALADKIDFLRSEHWNHLTHSSSVFFDRKVLSAIEAAGPAEIQPHYALLYRDGTPVAALVMQVVAITGGQLVKTPDANDAKAKQSKREKLASETLKHVHRRILVCGNLLSWGPHGVAIADGEDVGSIWPGIAEALYRVRRANKLMGQTDYVMLKDVSAEHHASMESMRRFRYRPKETEPDMVLEIQPQWQGFDDYLDTLNRKYRKPIKNVFKELEAAGCAVEREDNVAEHDARLHALYLAVNQRAKVRLVTIPEGYFGALADALGPDRFRCTVIRRDGDILGFVTTIRDGDTAIGYYLGMDYAANTDLPLYFRLLYAVIEAGIELGCKRISFGRTALEPKARLGCQPIPMHVWIRHRVPLVNYVAQQLFKTVPHDEAPERSPFKQS